LKVYHSLISSPFSIILIMSMSIFTQDGPQLLQQIPRFQENWDFRINSKTQYFNFCTPFNTTFSNTTSSITPSQILLHLPQKEDPSIHTTCPACNKEWKGLLKFHHCSISKVQDLNNKYQDIVERNGKLFCGLCLNQPQRPKELEHHLRNIHNIEPTRYRCEICSRNFLLQQRLTDHIRYIHHIEFGILGFCCPICAMNGFPSRKDLAIHVAGYHCPCPCPVYECPATFPTRREMEAHKMAQHNMASFRCHHRFWRNGHVCGMVFNNLKSLLTHYNTSFHQRPEDQEIIVGIICPLCGTIHFSKQRLVSHLQLQSCKVAIKLIMEFERRQGKPENGRIRL
jgi:hypothetical protein